MTDTKELLARIAALRSRLGTPDEPVLRDSHQAVEEKVRRGTAQNAMIESTLRLSDPGHAAPSLTPRLTARGARLLRQGKDLLQALRDIANDAEYQRPDPPSPAAREVGVPPAPPGQGNQGESALAQWHREGMAMLEVLLRTVQAMPAAVGAQLRMCDGLEVVVGEVRSRVERLESALAQRRRLSSRIDELAGHLRALASQRPVALQTLQTMADAILDEARSGAPLRFLYASPADPSRFAAAHGLTVAQVLVRLFQDDPAWEAQAPLAVIAALVHDVGMTRVPSNVLLTEGPLDADARRLIEKHTVIAEAMLAPLWPGGGWPIEAATCHHERNDGTGYPLGRQTMQLASYVRLLAVCDVYAALCAPRPYRPAFDTRTALTETLLLAERDHLDKASAERLLLLSFYPVGTAVELNDGAAGVVIATHAGAVGMTHPDRPIVHLTTDAAGQPLEPPMILDLLDHKDRSILRGLNTASRAP